MNFFEGDAPMKKATWTMLVMLAMLMPAICFAEESIETLIIDGQNNHKWADTTPVLKEMMEASGRFTVEVATTPPKGEDMSGFHPDFEKYDLLVMNYTGDRWPEATREDFERFVREGGGLVIYHAADNAFPDWPEYNEMIAIGGWGGRNEKSGPYLYWEDGEIVRDPSPGRGGGHGAQKPIQITVRESDHPIMKGLPPVFMHSADELYAFLRGPAKNVEVLATAYSDPENRGSGHHEPIFMTIRYGEGRVFHTVLGHWVTQIKSVAFITTFLRGSEWAATGEVTLPVPEDFPGPDASSVRE
jgi:type 1 glutamine amidotransferase